MAQPRKIFLVLLCCMIITALWGTQVFGDHGKKKKHKEKHGGHTLVLPAAYKDNCGGCHMAYGAYLLPAASWKKLLDNRDDHFGTALDINADQAAEIERYLLSNAADRNQAKISRKIMKRLTGQVPDRISTLSYIQHKHRKIDSSVFDRPLVGGIQNCLACHQGAEEGDFDDDRVRIPSSASR